MFSKKDRTNIILIIKRNTIEIVGETSNSLLELDPSIYKQLEIVNKPKYVEFLENKFRKLGISRMATVLILSDDICYYRQHKRKEDLVDYYNKIPIQDDQIISKTYIVKGIQTDVICNKSQLEVLKAMLERLTNNVISFIPEIVLRSNTPQGKLREIFEMDLNQLKSLDIFSLNTESISIIKKRKTLNLWPRNLNNSPHLKVFLTFTYMSLSLLLVSFFVKNLIENNDPKQIPPQSEINQSIHTEIIQPRDDIPEPIINTSDIPQEISPDMLSLMIYNGTNISGLATSTKETINEIPFKSIEVGNYESRTIKATIIYQRTDNYQKISDLLKEFLDRKYDNVEIETKELDSRYDIILLVGNNLK